MGKLQDRLSRNRARSTHGVFPSSSGTLGGLKTSAGLEHGGITLKDLGTQLDTLSRSLIRDSFINPAVSTIGNELSGQYALPQVSSSGLSHLINVFRPDYKSYTGTSSVLSNIFRTKKESSIRKQLIKDDILNYLSSI